MGADHPVAQIAQSVLNALAIAAGGFKDPDIYAGTLLGERAEVMGLKAPGRRSAGGSCCLVELGHATLAVNLPRVCDWDLVPAWLGEAVTPGDFEALEILLKNKDPENVLERARLLGLAVSLVNAVTDHRWYGSFTEEQIARQGAHATRSWARRPVVLDLSSLWAGPLAAHLLFQGGARVIKVESVERPDGARAGSERFFDLLNGGKESVAVEISTERGRAQLRALIDRANIVIESARPRALRQFGLDAADFVEARATLIWLSITGHGRAAPTADWIAYGDDAAAAGGLLAEESASVPVFLGDAIADPLTGIYAAWLVEKMWRAQCGQVVDVALAKVAHCVRREALRGSVQSYKMGSMPLCAARDVRRRAPALGADNARIFAEFAVPC